jgi:HPt (histidine-containing phosphotransfer) domain-containing protein
MMATSILLTTAERERKSNAIDETHLSRMTLGDRQLEREVLEIFVRQTAIMLDRIMSAERSLAAAATHTLLGSARGIGAWRVARAAERLELAAGEAGSLTDIDEAIAELKAASLEACAAIAARLTALLAELARAR